MSTIVITVDSKEPDRLFASTIRAMRRSLGVTEARLSRASGIGRQRIEVIETGGATTRAERHAISVALARLSRHRAAKALARSRLKGRSADQPATELTPAAPLQRSPRLRPAGWRCW
jgi:hypothetical protein